MNGYRVNAMEFISPDCTPKNLLLRAVEKGEDRGETTMAKYEILAN